MTCLKTILAKMTLNKPIINSYLASSISVEAKYYFLIHFINFRNKRPNKNPQKPKMAKFEFLAYCHPLINPKLRVISCKASAEMLNITFKNILSPFETKTQQKPKMAKFEFLGFCQP